MKLTTHDEVKTIHALRKTAREAGLFVVEKADAFLLYRETPPQNVLVGTGGVAASDPAGERRGVRDLGADHPEEG